METKKDDFKGRELVFSLGRDSSETDSLFAHGIPVLPGQFFSDIYSLCLEAQSGDRINIYSWKSFGLEAKELASFLLSCIFKNVRIFCLEKPIRAFDNEDLYASDVPLTTILSVFAEVRL